MPNDKMVGILLVAVGGLAAAGSFYFIGHPDHAKWFPMLLIVGGTLAWWGVSKYRAA